MPGRHALAVGFVFSLIAALCASVSAQEFRGSISGIVADGSGGVLPGVTVVVANVDTQIKQSAVTDAEGRYRMLYLNPGIYSVEAELSGFKKFAAQTRLSVGDAARLDIVLQPGGLEEVVTVVAASSLLNTSSGISGTTVDATQIAELPLGDGTAYMLTRLAPGIMDASDLHFARPADNGNLGGIVGNGVTGGNEFSIDGAPNMSNARGVGFSPPSDAIAEFKVQTNAFDAQTGHTAGAVVNLALKSGTNALRGAFGYFNRDDARTATPLLTQRANGDKPTREYNRSTATLSGPVLKNRTFFMGSFEHLRDVQPEPTTYTVPTVGMRRGDFSEFGANAIYDPFTVTTAGARSPFAGNTIPLDRINPIAAAYAQLYPLPNRPGTVANYFTNQLRPYDYNAGMGRIDHNLSNAHRLYGTAYWNKRQEDRYNWAQDAENAVDGGVINGVPVTRGFDYRTNLGVTSGYTAALSTSLLFDLRVSGARFGEWRDPADEIDPAVLGFSSNTLQLMRGYNYLPLFTLGSFSTTNENSTIASLGARRSDWSQGFDRPFVTLAVQPTLTRVFGAHTARAGYDLRRQVWTITNAGFRGGRFAFTGAYTRLNNSAATNDRAQSWAQFLLGLPTAATGTVANAGGNISQFDTAAPGEFSQAMHGLFFQDDWRVNDRLTVNAGLRLEINTGMSEADNRNIAGFDFETPNPIAAAAAAAYQRSPIPELAASAFRVNGGLRFADGPVNNTIAKLLPRGAFAYMLDQRTVVRAGAGLFSYDYFFENINQTGFSQATPVISTTDNGITFTGATLSNPIPNGQLIEAVGSANGLASQLGQNLGTLYQPEREAPYYTRWEGSVQRDFGRGWVGSLTYVGSRGSNLPVARQVNNLAPQYLSGSRSRDLTQEALLSANVTNPFAGLLPGSTINGATIQRQNLLRPYPQFGTFAVEVYDGTDRYHAGTIQMQKRFAEGSSITTQYTHSSLRDSLNYLNPQDGVLEDRVSPNDRPHRFSLGTVLRVPLGRDQRWGSGWNRAADALLGGWQLSTTYQYQSGAPLVWGNSIYYSETCGDPGKLKSFIGEKVQGGIGGLDVPGWDASCFYFSDALVQTNGAVSPALQRADQRIQLGNNVRYFPSTLTGVRTDDLHLLDFGLSKRFELPRGVRVQVRFEAINALDYTVLWNPNLDPRNANFGLINQDRNNPRDWQIGLKLTF